MDPCHTESQSELSASDRVPGIRHREGGRSEARQGAGDKTAEGNKHAEEQATSPVEPRTDHEGEGNQEKTERGQGEQAGTHAIDLSRQRTYPQSPSQEPGASSLRHHRSQGLQDKREKLGALFQQSLPC